MALQEAQQFFSLMAGKKELLVALPTHPSVDSVCSGLALKTLLEKRGARVELVAPGFVAPPTLSWLPNVADVRSDVPPLGKLSVTLDLGSVRYHDIVHDISDGKVTFHITPATGAPRPDVPIQTSVAHRFDSVIVLGAQDHAALGPLYDSARDLFFRVPVVVLDNHPGNERFGTVNIVSPAASAISEIVFDLFGEDRAALDEIVATYLLTGLISATKSFKQESVSPRALAITADLMAAGARREEIVKQLYRTKSVETLRLWGRALSRLKHDPAGLVWTVVGSADYLHTGARPEDVPGMIDELIAFAPEAEIALVLYETADGICGILETRRTHNARRLAASFPELAGTHQSARFCLKQKTLLDAEQEVIANLKSTLAS